MQPEASGKAATSRRVRSALPLLLGLLLSACTTGAGPRASATPAASATLPPDNSTPAAPPASSSPAAGDALLGTWDTGPFRTNEYAGHDTFEVRLTFYSENAVPFVTMAGWDPTREEKPSGGDHGPYHLLPDNQIAIAGADLPGIFTIYRYDLAGGVLTLTWLRNDPHGPDASDTTGPFSMIRLHRD